MSAEIEKLAVTVLCVDDDETSLKLLNLMLRKKVDVLFTARNGREAFEMFLQHRPDIVITDIMMPGMSGLDLSRCIRELDQKTSIVITTAFNSTDFLVQSIDLAVTQFVMKPFNEKYLIKALEHCYHGILRERALREQNERISILSRALEESPAAVAILSERGLIEFVNRKFSELTGWKSEELIGMDICATGEFDGWWQIRDAARAGLNWQAEIQFPRKHADIFWGRARLAPFSHGTGNSRKFILMIEDISDQKRYEKELHYLATHDALTGLYNRGFYEIELQRLTNGRYFPVSVIMADIDGLKAVNDQMGHEAGDKLIKAAASVLADSFRADDVVARIGGDEFAVVVRGANADVMLNIVKRNLLTRQFIEHAGHRIPVSLSFGTATASCCEELAVMQTKADALMYQDKAAKKTRPHTGC